MVTTRQAPVRQHLLTVPEAGVRLGVSRATAYRYVADGELDVVDMARRGAKKTKLRVTPEALAQFIQRRALEAA